MGTSGQAAQNVQRSTSKHGNVGLTQTVGTSAALRVGLDQQQGIPQRARDTWAETALKLEEPQKPLVAAVPGVPCGLGAHVSPLCFSRARQRVRSRAGAP